jgi:hypothetical protein
VPRFGHWRRLRPSVDMTSDVKGGEQLVYVCLILFPFVSSSGRAGARKTRRLITLLSVGWLPPALPPSGACRMRGPRVPGGLRTPPRVTPPRGGVSAESGWTLLPGASTRRPLSACGDPAPCVAMAHRKARHARAMATTTCVACLPGASRWRERVPRRPWAFELLASSAGGRVARRRGRCRLPWAGYR